MMGPPPGEIGQVKEGDSSQLSEVLITQDGEICHHALTKKDYNINIHDFNS